MQLSKRKVDLASSAILEKATWRGQLTVPRSFFSETALHLPVVNYEAPVPISQSSSCQT